MDYRGAKFDIWEGGHREPTAISYPRMIKPGMETNSMVSHSDIYGTLADLLDIDISDTEAEDSIYRNRSGN